MDLLGNRCFKLLLSSALGLLICLAGPPHAVIAQQGDAPADSPASQGASTQGASTQPADSVAAVAQLFEKAGASLNFDRDIPRENEGVSGAPAAVVSGIVISEDGSPVMDYVEIAVETVRPHSNRSSFGAKDGRFQGQVYPGQVLVKASAPGWVGANIGPLEVTADKPLDDITVVLSRGISMEVQVTDPDGKPIAGAIVSASRGTVQASAQTGADGVALVEHVLPMDLSVWVRSRDYFPCGRVVTVGEQTRVKMILAPIPPTIGTVLDKATGKPIPGASIYSNQFFDECREVIGSERQEGQPVAYTDEQGHFSFCIQPESSTVMMVATPDHRTLIRKVSPGQSLVFQMPEPLYVHGFFTGKIQELRKTENGEYLFYWSNPYWVEGYEDPFASGRMSALGHAKMVNGKVEFLLPYLFPGKLKIESEIKTVELDLTKPVTDLEIRLGQESGPQSKNTPSQGFQSVGSPAMGSPVQVNQSQSSRSQVRQSQGPEPEGTQPLATQSQGLAALSGAAGLSQRADPPMHREILPLGNLFSMGLAAQVQAETVPTRQVIVKFVPPPGAKQVKGFVKAGPNRLDFPFLEVKDNQVTFQARVGEHCFIDWQNLPGTSGKVMSFKVDAGNDPLILTPELLPAGAVLCTVVDEEGEPVYPDPHYPPLAALNVSAKKLGHGYVGYQKGLATPVLNQFVLSPLPLGIDLQVYCKSARDGTSALASARVTLTPDHPTREITLVVHKPTRSVGIQLLDPKGQPARGVTAVVGCLVDQSGLNMGTHYSDGQGMLYLEGYDLAAADKWFLRVQGGASWGDCTIDVPTDKSQVTLSLPPSLTLRGRLINSDGRPVICEGLQVYRFQGYPLDTSSASPRTWTDEQGRFEVTGLGAGQYEIRPADYIMQPTPGADGQPGKWPIVQAGDAEPVNIDVNERLREGVGYRLGDFPTTQPAGAPATQPAGD